MISKCSCPHLSPLAVQRLSPAANSKPPGSCVADGRRMVPDYKALDEMRNTNGCVQTRARLIWQGHGMPRGARTGHIATDKGRRFIADLRLYGYRRNVEAVNL